MRGKVEAGRDTGTVSLFQAKALSIYLCSTLPASDKGLLNVHKYTKCTRSHKYWLSCITKEKQLVAGLKPLFCERSSTSIPILQFLKHLKENVEPTFHHCQIMPAKYSYFSPCKLTCSSVAFKYSSQAPTSEYRSWKQKSIMHSRGFFFSLAITLGFPTVIAVHFQWL